MEGHDQEKLTPTPTATLTAPDSRNKEENGSSTTSTSLVNTNPNAAASESKPPPLHFAYRWWGVTLYIVFLLICNVLLPCLLYYLLQIYTELDLRGLVGISSAALGVSSCFDAPFRLYRLVKRRREFGPLANDTWWHLDFFMWLYTLCLLVFAFPLAIAPAIPLYNFFLMSTAMLVGPVGVVLLISLFRLRLRGHWCSSDPPGSRMKPAIFYCVEDIAAVDFMNGREFRTAMAARWNASIPFQSLMTYLTIYWSIACFVYVGITAAVTWAAPYDFAFGYVLGQFFIWAAVAAVGSKLLTRWGLKRELEWWRNQKHTEPGGSVS